MCHIRYINGVACVYKHTGTPIQTHNIGPRRPDGGHSVTFKPGDTRIVYQSEKPPAAKAPIRPSSKSRSSWASENINPLRPRASAFWTEKSR